LHAHKETVYIVRNLMFFNTFTATFPPACPGPRSSIFINTLCFSIYLKLLFTNQHTLFIFYILIYILNFCLKLNIVTFKSNYSDILCNIAFKEHLPEDGHKQQLKHVQAGYAIYNTINLHICICTCWLYFWQ
jgi:hypothetical protein